MILPRRESLNEALLNARISRRLMRDLRYSPESITHPDERDFLVVTNKSGNEGVIMFEDAVRVFERQRRSPNAAGRTEAVICDICATWQRGAHSAVLVLRSSSNRSVSHLVCGDLDCSLHVRDLTDASKLSRTQLRENITPQARIERLTERLRAILE